MHISQEQLRATFRELIEINSFYPEDFPVQRYVASRLQHKNITYIEDDFGNIIASLAGNPTKQPIMLNTHIDIPEDTPVVAYQETPQGIEGTGETILGADPKTGLAVLIELALALADEDPKNYAPIDFVFTRGEEQGLIGASALDLTKVRAREGLVIDEDGPASVLVTKAPGMIKFEGTFVGTTAHSREPWLGINALQMAVDALARAPLGYTNDSQQVTWNLGVLHAGAAINSVPGSATFLAEMRSFDGHLLQTEAQRIYDIFAAIATQAGGVLEASLETLYEPYERRSNDPLLAKVTGVLETFHLTPSHLETYGASDANILNARGVTCMAIGSGYYNAHQYIECADLGDMHTLTKILDAYIRL